MNMLQDQIPANIVDNYLQDIATKFDANFIQTHIQTSRTLSNLAEKKSLP
jgi:hypothetical protein